MSTHSLKQKCINIFKLSTILNDLKDYNIFHKNSLKILNNLLKKILMIIMECLLD